MMRRTKTKTEITLEKRERTLIRLRCERRVWCPTCAAQVQMFSSDEAARLTQTTARAIFRRVEAGELHFVEAGSGALLICSASLRLIRQKQEEEGKYR